MHIRKITQLICQNPKCKKKYDALRSDSTCCCDACRVALFRHVQKEKNKYQSLRTRNPRDDDKLIALKLKLASVLELALAVEERARVPVEAVKILLKKLEAIMNEWYGNRKKHLIQDQMEWIWMYLIGYLTQLDDSCKKSGNLECFVTFTTQMRCMIYKLIKVEKARW